MLDAAGAAHLSSEQVQALHLAAGEAATNVVEHAYGPEGGSLRLRTYRHGPTFSVEIADHGRWREGAAREMSGRGTSIMRALVDDMDITRAASGTTVRLSMKTG
ncbi:MAG TPA: ATP-binding protein [bacterium]